MGFLDQHRGPYRFCVVRPGRKPGFFSSEWLPGETDRDDVESEALALLSDPRDTIRWVGVWSIRDECHIGAYRS